MGGEVKVLFFGQAAEATGKTEEMFTTGTTASLRGQLIEKYPALKQIPFRLALNKTMLRSESELKPNDIIAVLPPFQGG